MLRLLRSYPVPVGAPISISDPKLHLRLQAATGVSVSLNSVLDSTTPTHLRSLIHR